MTSSNNTAQAFTSMSMLITGAGFDIGKALAIRCAQRGAHVILMDKDNRALNALYDEIIAANCCEPTILKIDAEEFSGESSEPAIS